MAKSKHKHQYELQLSKVGRRWWLRRVCTVCGLQKDVPIKMLIVREGGTFRFLSRKEDFLKAYPNVKVVE